MISLVRAGLLAVALGFAGTAGLVTSSGVAVAAKDKGPFSARVRTSCKGDYNRFCPGYNLYSHELRRCMQAAGKNISRGCIRALVDAGEVPRSMLKN